LNKRKPEAGSRFQKLVEIIARLRSPGGCPWDRARTREEILNYFLEEVYEAVEAVKSGSAEEAREELGDVLMEVVFLARFYEEEGKFTVAEALEAINRKMVERHPHVFGRKKLKTAQEILEVWQNNKLVEKKRESILDGLPASASALVYAFLLGQRVSAHGFDWSGPAQALRKVKEELKELEKSLKRKDKREAAEELGDLLFSLVNVSRLLGLNPEIVLAQANRKFENRFRELEKRLKKQGRKVGECSLAQLDEVWDEVKRKKPQKGKGGRLKNLNSGRVKSK
jgi:MazG family protein